MVQKIFFALSFALILSSCQSDDSFKITDPFPFEKCTSFVIYAGKSFDDNPDKSFPSHVIHDYDIHLSVMHADRAPYLTALTAEEMVSNIVQWKKKTSTIADGGHVTTVEAWVNQKVEEGWTHFLYETEPKKYAGNAYPWAQYADKNR